MRVFILPLVGREKQWYPIAVETFLDRSKPHAMKLLGKDIVIWYDGITWRVFDDRCPHRAVPLSEGRIEKEHELMCAYHGWRFAGNGTCTSIPQADTQKKEQQLMKTSQACTRSFPVMTVQGLIWCWGESGVPGSDVMIESKLKQPRLIEDLLHPTMNTSRTCVFFHDFRDLPYGWDYFMENTLDPAHVPVSHHNFAGNRYHDAKPLNLTRVLSRSEIPVAEGGEFDPSFPEDAGFKYVSHPLTSKFDAYTSTDFRPPCLNKIDNVSKDGAKFILGAYATPTAPGYCRHISVTIKIKPVTKSTSRILGVSLFSRLSIPNWFVHLFSSLFVQQDLLFLHKQERKITSTHSYAFGHFPDNCNVTSDAKAYSTGLFMPNNQDISLLALRNWISRKAGGGPKWGAESARLPTILPNEKLFDVYEMHTKSCKQCLSAMKT